MAFFKLLNGFFIRAGIGLGRTITYIIKNLVDYIIRRIIGRFRTSFRYLSRYLNFRISGIELLDLFLRVFKKIRLDITRSYIYSLPIHFNILDVDGSV